MINGCTKFSFIKYAGRGSIRRARASQRAIGCHSRVTGSTRHDLHRFLARCRERAGLPRGHKMVTMILAVTAVAKRLYGCGQATS
eukprot:SAG11_NODE_2963_length_2807_cov_4.781019_7_plen_85_part_00